MKYNTISPFMDGAICILFTSTDSKPQCRVPTTHSSEGTTSHWQFPAGHCPLVLVDGTDILPRPQGQGFELGLFLGAQDRQDWLISFCKDVGSFPCWMPAATGLRNRYCVWTRVF